MENQFLHEVAITAIIIKNGNSKRTPEPKFLITRRSLKKKRFPGMWTVPGGKLQVDDYLHLKKDTKFYWYNVLERTLKREVYEETKIKIKDVEYLTSLATIHNDGTPSIVISCIAEYVSGKFKPQPGESDASAWVTLKEAKEYELLDGIYEELIMAEKRLKGVKLEWKRFKK